jgi:hypothetical protein
MAGKMPGSGLVFCMFVPRLSERTAGKRVGITANKSVVGGIGTLLYSISKNDLLA